MNLTIFGRTLPQHKKINFALTELYGIGRSSANEISRDLGFLPTLKVKDLTEIQKIQIAKKIKNEFLVEGGLEEEIKLSKSVSLFSNHSYFLTKPDKQTFSHLSI